MTDLNKRISGSKSDDEAKISYRAESRRHYQSISNDKRVELIRLVHEEKRSVKDAAKMLEIPYENAKAINKVYKREGRVEKKTCKVKRQKNKTAQVEYP